MNDDCNYMKKASEKLLTCHSALLGVHMYNVHILNIVWPFQVDKLCVFLAAVCSKVFGKRSVGEQKESERVIMRAKKDERLTVNKRFRPLNMAPPSSPPPVPLPSRASLNNNTNKSK